MRLTTPQSLLVAALLMLPACTTSADAMGMASAADTKGLCGAAAEKFGKGDIQRAFADMGPHWPLAREEIDALATESRKQMGMVGTRFGTYVGVEHIRTSQAGDSFLRQLFAIKFENHALRFSCAFYKPRDRWLVNTINWDDKPFLSIDSE
jgi:hypothetical protein